MERSEVTNRIRDKMKLNAGGIDMKQIKKVMAFVLFFSLVMGQFTDLSSRAKSYGYKFTYKKVTVYMGGPAKKLIKKAGKPKSKKAAKSCAYDGKDRTYK